MLAANVPAVNDLWLVGDYFLGDILGMLQKMRNNTTTPVYMYEHYNVCAYYTNPSNGLRNAYARILNAMIKGLNEHIRLPKFIMIMCDIDVLNTICFFNKGMPVAFEKCISWFIKQVDQSLETRKENMYRKRPGSVSGQTRIIWVHIINRPIIRNHPDKIRNKVLAGRNRYNITLNDIVADTRYHHTLIVGRLDEIGFFTNLGNLNDDGAREYWREIDY